jgi:hypothetical protein
MHRQSLPIAGLAIAALAVGGCSESGSRAEAGAPAEASAPATAAPASVTPTEAPAVAAEAGATPAAGNGPPAFAEPVPGAEIQQVTAGDSADAEGGLAVYTTDVPPEDVIAFYRSRAEAAGLASTMAMTQGDTHAYGASDADGATNVSIVASPDGQRTSVQVSWSRANTP